MKWNKLSRAVTIGGIAAIAGLVVFMVFLQVEDRRNNDFRKSIDKLAVDVIALTGEYQAEEGKWVRGQYDNSTMIGIIEKYDVRYQDIVNRAINLDTPDRYVAAKDFLIKAVETEQQGNMHLRNYIGSGSQVEYQKSIELVSLSLQYSADFDAAIKAAG